MSAAPPFKQSAANRFLSFSLKTTENYKGEFQKVQISHNLLMNLGQGMKFKQFKFYSNPITHT
jgi:hypothetical protein